MNNKKMKLTLILGLCVILLFSLVVAGGAPPTNTKKSPLKAGTYYIPNVGPVVIKGEDLNPTLMGNFNRLEVERQKDSPQDLSTNLFKHGEQMLPGDQVTDFVYIYNRPDDKVVSRPNLSWETEFIHGGLVVLVARIPEDATGDGAALEKDSHGVEGYLESPLSKQLLHETLIHIDPVVFKEEGDPFQRLVEGSPNAVPLESRPTTQRVDGCSFQKTEGTTQFTKQEYAPENHEAGRTTEPVILGFIQDGDHLGMRIQLKVPLWLGNEFENVEGRIFWDFYYLPGKLLLPPEKQEGGTSVVDVAPFPSRFIPDEEPAATLPGLVFLGTANPFGALPKTGGESWSLSTGQTLIIFLTIGVIGLLLFELVGRKKKENKESE